MRPDRRDAGFTLVESLAAFTMLALAMIVFMEGMATSFRTASGSRTREDLLRLARGQLDAAGVTEKLTTGVKTGTFPGGYSWTQKTSPYALMLSDARGDVPHAFWIEVSVAQQPAGTPVVRLQTLRIQ